jgi:hypothetical protein
MRSRGWVFMDVLVATMLVGILAIILSKAIGAHQSGINHLADTRAASRLAESAMSSMQSGEAPMAGDANQSIAIRKDSPAAGITGMSWVEVDAGVDGRHASLVGLVPLDSIPGGGK